MNFLLHMLMPVASMLHITASTVYHVMPDNHYHPINDNTYTLQHYLNNTNKYFTSNTQLHFLPGQYYLNNDLIIQGVSNFSLIGNRTNEVINTVINCTSPAGIVVVNSSNIVIANIVMDECGNNYKSLLMNMLPNQHGYNKTLFVLNSKIITIRYVYSIWYQKLCGFELVNALDSKLSNLVSTYLSIWYTGSDNATANATDTLVIEKFQIYNAVHDIYSIQIEWHNTVFDFQLAILNVNFRNDLALIIRCKDCLGHNVLTITNCSFSDSDLRDVSEYYEYDGSSEDYAYDYSYEDLENDSLKYTCDDDICMDKIMIHYQFTNLKMDKTANRLYFSNCLFMTNYSYIYRMDSLYKVLHIVVENNYYREVHTNVQSFVIHDCLFYHNYKIQLLSVECINDGDSRMHCVSVLIQNTTFSSNILGINDLIYFAYVIVIFEDVTVINNKLNMTGFHINITRDIIHAHESHIKYNKYNEISCNYAYYAIRGLAVYVHVNENSVLNISFNILRLNTVIVSEQPAGFEICVIQYISERGNLDKEFQTGQKLNYSIVINSNNMSKILIII